LLAVQQRPLVCRQEGAQLHVAQILACNRRVCQEKIAESAELTAELAATDTLPKSKEDRPVDNGIGRTGRLCGTGTRFAQSIFIFCGRKWGFLALFEKVYLFGM
jgi:hypothetical protein